MIKRNFSNELQNYWEKLEKNYPAPKYVSAIKEISFERFSDELDSKNIKFAIYQFDFGLEYFFQKNFSCFLQ